MKRILFWVGVAAVLATTSSFGQAPAFSQVVVFGDSLSDTGNVRARTSAKSSGAIDYPSHTFNYDNGRFTNDTDTDPATVQSASADVVRAERWMLRSSAGRGPC